jgi:putative heme iron utilization protein
MDVFLARVRDLLTRRATGALGTLQDGAPFVSLVPFALVPGAALIHVSGLAAHTRNLLADPRASLLVSDPEDSVEDVRSLPRVTLQVEARALEPGSTAHTEARRAYLARFSDPDGVFDLGDFQLFALEFRNARAVLGFGQARTLSAAELAETLAG